MEGEKTIADLAEMVDALPAQERALSGRIFRVITTTGSLVAPPSMNEWMERQFGSLEAVCNQRIVRVTNLVTMEGAIFNALRSMRPRETTSEASDLDKMVMQAAGGPFCHPERNTPEDVFGRIRGRHCTTASSVAKFDGFHGLVIFDQHNPLDFSVETISDYLDTGLAWARKVHQTDSQAKYFFLVWNCLWRGGATILHGHIQVTMASAMHYAKIEHLRRAALDYQERYGSNYFEDLYSLHSALGLTAQMGNVGVLAYLTPIAKDEVLLISKELDQDLKDSVYQVLWRLTHLLGVRSFNLALCMAPIGPVEEDWEHFPVIVRLIDRGDLASKTCDLNGMSLYASSVISSDPFELAAFLRNESTCSGVERPPREEGT